MTCKTKGTLNTALLSTRDRAAAPTSATADMKLAVSWAQVRRVCPNAAFVLQLMRWQRINCRPEAWRWSAPTVSNVKVLF